MFVCSIIHGLAFWVELPAESPCVGILRIELESTSVVSVRGGNVALEVLRLSPTNVVLRDLRPGKIDTGTIRNNGQISPLNPVCSRKLVERT